MTVGWQEIISLTVVGFAVYLLIRRGLKPGSGTGGCGGSCAQTSSEDRTLRITELHTIDVDPRLQVIDAESPTKSRDATPQG